MFVDGCNCGFWDDSVRNGDDLILGSLDLESQTRRGLAVNSWWAMIGLDLRGMMTSFYTWSFFFFINNKCLFCLFSNLHTHSHTFFRRLLTHWTLVLCLTSASHHSPFLVLQLSSSFLWQESLPSFSHFLFPSRRQFLKYLFQPCFCYVVSNIHLTVKESIHPFTYVFLVMNEWMKERSLYWMI